MDAVLFALSFEVVLLQMKIIEGSVTLRLAGWRPTNKIEKLQQDKLAKDRDFVNDVIRRTLLEVAENGTWQSVINAVELLKQSECDVESLHLRNEQLKTSRRTLEAELDAKRNQWATELNNADQKVALLRDKMSELAETTERHLVGTILSHSSWDSYLRVHIWSYTHAGCEYYNGPDLSTEHHLASHRLDDLHNAKTRLCYAEKWLFARFESLELKLNAPRAPLPRADHEQRVHDELLKAIELQLKELEKTLEYWRQRYDTDIAEISARSQMKLEQLLIASSKRQELQALYNLHEGEMRGWLTFKRERAARLAREKKLRLSAMRIQAWWRGVMVRRALGQFKFLRHTKGKGKKK